MGNVADGKPLRKFAMRLPALLDSPAGTASPAHVLTAQRERFFGLAACREPGMYLDLFPLNHEYSDIAIPWGDERYSGLGWRRDRAAALDAWLTSRETTLEQLIEKWQERYRLPDQWCADCAMATLMQGWPGMPYPADFPVTGVMSVVPYRMTTAHDVTPVERIIWTQEFETWEDVEARVLARLREVKRQRLETAPQHPPIPQRNPWHMLWLVDFLIGRQSPYLLAPRYWPELSGWEDGKDHLHKARTIYAGIQSAARDIQLTLPQNMKTG